MRKTGEQLYVPENTGNKNLDTCPTIGVKLLQMKRQSKQPTGKKKPIETRITFRATGDDVKIINAGMEKHGLRTASDIIRMALRTYRSSEGLEVA